MTHRVATNAILYKDSYSIGRTDTCKRSYFQARNLGLIPGPLVSRIARWFALGSRTRSAPARSLIVDQALRAQLLVCTALSPISSPPACARCHDNDDNDDDGRDEDKRWVFGRCEIRCSLDINGPTQQHRFLHLGNVCRPPTRCLSHSVRKWMFCLIVG